MHYEYYKLETDNMKCLHIQSIPNDMFLYSNHKLK